MKKTKYIILSSFLVITVFFGNARNLPKSAKATKKSAQTVTAGCLPASTSVDLDLNNVRALIHTGGDMWWDLASNPRYEVPKGSGKQALFAGGIWVGGRDINGQLRLAARTYRSEGNDYWPGPLVKSGEGIASVTPEVCSQYDKFWKIKKDDVEKFVNYMNASAEIKAQLFSNYVVPTVIKEWPAHGPVDQDNYDFYMAPFHDVDGDGVYKYENGDYPNFDIEKTGECKFSPVRVADSLGNSSQRLFGDETMWWVYNDKGNVHTQSSGAAAIGMEFRGQAFAFSTNDELNNMTFYNYQIVNRSTYTLTDAYFGVWTDADMGEPEDDYVGCDVVHGLGYLYNGKEFDGDGSGKTYGKYPPAVGIDFFEGPYQDPNGKDDLTSWKEFERSNLDCTNGYIFSGSGGENIIAGQGDIFNGNINGLNFGDGIIDNERWGMRRFIYYNRSDFAPNAGMGEPSAAVEFYNYLRGFWKDGTRMTYGGDGYGDGSDPADFMFPFDTDKCNWGTYSVDQAPWSENNAALGGAANPPGDRRFVQSAGPFTLEPGAVNDITIGAVWARANSTAWASVEAVRSADIKAQRLFENCFQLIDGPSAPDLTIIELDKKLIFQLSNKPGTNNYLESYHDKDPFIDVTVDFSKQFYDFQGYQVYQVVNKNVTIADLSDINKARQVFQCDVMDSVTQIVNFTWDPDLQANIPVEMVYGENKGITHTFELTYDAFATGHSRDLVNYKDYYFFAVAYAYNNYAPYVPSNTGSLGKQTKPYLMGRKNIGPNGTGLPYSATPHSIDALNNGTEISASYGDVPAITVLEGRGNGYNFLEISDESYAEILANGKATTLSYKENYGPVKVKVIDPINVIDANFTLRLVPDSVNPKSNYYNPATNQSFIPTSGLILDSRWELVYNYQGIEKTITSNAWFRHEDEMLIPELGLSITFNQVEFPGKISNKFENLENSNNGFIGASLTYKNELPQWLYNISDIDGNTPFNWIRSGSQKADEQTGLFGDWIGRDPESVYERVLGGSWAPYALTSKESYGVSYPAANNASSAIPFTDYRLPSVDIVITKDQSLWTRCPVIEMAENDADGSTNSLSEGGALKFQLRKAPSKNKDGVAATTTEVSDDPNSPNFISATGMSWFPGYAVDVETGERLNMMFGEDSWLVGENGNDMLWNPTSSVGDGIFVGTAGNQGIPHFGGKHVIWIVGHNNVVGNVMPAYDYGRTIIERLDITQVQSQLLANMNKVWKHPVWCAVPMVGRGHEFIYYADMPDNDVKIKLRVANPYFVGVGDFAKENPVNENFPAFTFTTSHLSAKKDNIDASKKALDKVNIVPNPYYGYSTYETSQVDNKVKITNLPESCVISIYTPNGSLVRQFKKDNSESYVEWDLKNTYGITIASGMYIIHVNVPGVGEKVIKWLGALRPVDLNSF